MALRGHKPQKPVQQSTGQQALDYLDSLNKYQRDLLPMLSLYSNAWSSLAVSSPWANGSTPFQFMKDALGFVHLRGHVSCTVAESNAVIGTLPPGYRPAQAMSFHALLNSGVAGGFLGVTAAGVVTGTSPDADSLFVDGITFLAEQ